jgi:hypothetical protein
MTAVNRAHVTRLTAKGTAATALTLAATGSETSWEHPGAGPSVTQQADLSSPLADPAIGVGVTVSPDR